MIFLNFGLCSCEHSPFSLLISDPVFPPPCLSSLMLSLFPPGFWWCPLLCFLFDSLRPSLLTVWCFLLEIEVPLMNFPSMLLTCSSELLTFYLCLELISLLHLSAFFFLWSHWCFVIFYVDFEFFIQHLKPFLYLGLDSWVMISWKFHMVLCFVFLVFIYFFKNHCFGFIWGLFLVSRWLLRAQSTLGLRKVASTCFDRAKFGNHYPNEPEHH